MLLPVLMIGSLFSLAGGAASNTVSIIIKAFLNTVCFARLNFQFFVSLLLNTNTLISFDVLPVVLVLVAHQLEQNETRSADPQTRMLLIATTE